MPSVPAKENAPILMDVRDGVATVVLNRPDVRNAITLAMWRKLAGVFAALGEDRGCRVAILAGAGADFSAGADIGEFDTVRGDAGSARGYEAANSAAFAAIRDAPFPVIAAIAGVCLGGGFGLAAACDIRIASEDAVFAVPAGRLGLAYPADAMADIVNGVGPQMARYLTCSAARIDAGRASSAGFLLEVTEPEKLHERARDIARDIGAGAPLSVRASKAAIRAALSRSEADGRAAAALGDATFESRDYAEGRTAFREKRPPAFEGR